MVWHVFFLGGGRIKKKWFLNLWLLQLWLYSTAALYCAALLHSISSLDLTNTICWTHALNCRPVLLFSLRWKLYLSAQILMAFKCTVLRILFIKNLFCSLFTLIWHCINRHPIFDIFLHLTYMFYSWYITILLLAKSE